MLAALPVSGVAAETGQREDTNVMQLFAVTEHIGAGIVASPSEEHPLFTSEFFGGDFRLDSGNQFLRFFQRGFGGEKPSLFCTLAWVEFALPTKGNELFRQFARPAKGGSGECLSEGVWCLHVKRMHLLHLSCKKFFRKVFPCHA